MKKKTIGLVILAVALLGVIVFLAGPRPRVEYQPKTFVLPADLDRYLAETEAQYPDIVPGTEKTIVWAYPDKRKTALSIIYLHGYSASRQEAAPLSDQLAARWGANLFYTRLTGHGQTGAALAQATNNDFLNDAVEAVEIGKRLGEQVIVIGTSNGGALATWLATQPKYQADVLAYVLMSPNFGLRDPKSVILGWPWAHQLVPLVVGPEYGWTPLNPEHEKYWTERYPSTALLQPASLGYYVRALKLETVQEPILVIYSPNDIVVDTRIVEQAYARFGSPVKKLVPITDSANPEGHVLAGDILAAADTERVANLIDEFVAPLR